jgi:hypothetical protein
VVNGLWASPAVRPFRKEKRLLNATSPSSGETSSASEAPLSQRLGRRLLRYGIVLFLLGLATGRLVQYVPLPRMGLSSHLQSVMNGTFLVVLGLVWPHLRLHALLLRAAYWLALVGTYLNWAVRPGADLARRPPRPQRCHVC